MFFNVALVDLPLLLHVTDCSVLIVPFSFGTSLFVEMLVIAALPVVDGGFEWKAECYIHLKMNRLPFGAACKFLSSGIKQLARSSAPPRISYWSIKSFTLEYSGTLSLYFSMTTRILSFWQIEQHIQSKVCIPCFLYDLYTVNFIFPFFTLPLTNLTLV